MHKVAHRASIGWASPGYFSTGEEKEEHMIYSNVKHESPAGASAPG